MDKDKVEADFQRILQLAEIGRGGSMIEGRLRLGSLFPI